MWTYPYHGVRIYRKHAQIRGGLVASCSSVPLRVHAVPLSAVARFLPLLMHCRRRSRGVLLSLPEIVHVRSLHVHAIERRVARIEYTADRAAACERLLIELVRVGAETHRQK